MYVIRYLILFTPFLNNNVLFRYKKSRFRMVKCYFHYPKVAIIMYRNILERHVFLLFALDIHLDIFLYEHSEFLLEALREIARSGEAYPV